MKRIPPSSKLRQEVEKVFLGWETGGHPLDNFVSLGARYMLQVAVEQEVEDFLGRAHYQRGSRQRNGKQPCLAHKMRNILCKLPKKIEKEMKSLIKQVYYASGYEEGLKLGHELIARFKDRYTSAMECLDVNLAECLTYLKFSQAHWKVIRTSNLLELTFGEGKRRTKVIPVSLPRVLA